MCVLIVCRGADPSYPLILAANREEDPQRPTAPPGLHRAGPRRVLCPLDRRHGGTWLGVNDAGVVAALTNLAGVPAPAEARSRGEATLRALAADDAASGVEGVRTLLGVERLRPLQMVIADARRCFWLRHGVTLESRELDDRVVLASNRHEPGGFEVAGLESWAEAAAVSPSDIAARLDHLVVLLATAHGVDKRSGNVFSLSTDVGRHRTVSATVLAVPDDPRQSKLLYCHGHPRTGQLKDYSGLAARL
jgi:hypothetical protein